VNREETKRLLAAAAARDNRQPSEPMLEAWLVDLGDLPYDLAVAAVNRHFRTSTDYLMPVHVRRLAEEIHREHRRERREAHEALTREHERLALDSRPLADRSAEVRQLVAETVEKLSAAETGDAAHERALLVARSMKGRPDTSAAPKTRSAESRRAEYGPPATRQIADLARQYLADGHSPRDLSRRLGISEKWLRRAAADPGSLPPPTPVKPSPLPPTEPAQSAPVEQEQHA